MITKQEDLGSYICMVHMKGDMTTKIGGKTKTLTPSEITEITYAFVNELSEKGFTTTIDPTIASLYKDYGYIVEKEGVGWKAKSTK